MTNRWFRVVALVIVFCCALVFLGPKGGLDAGRNFVGGLRQSKLPAQSLTPHRSTLRTLLQCLPRAIRAHIRRCKMHKAILQK